ncbi:restriction endonuclease subunit S [Staphylococcus felis]|uniref:restriction endonuclease subunit S n=1 Tax=Staphylococcus felis TaxID=46127 RepID=UPI00396732B1
MSKHSNTPELRFPEFDGEWEEKKLGDIADFTKGKLLGKKDLIDEGKYPCILYGELYTKYGSIINDVVSRTNVNKDKLKKGSKNQILIPSSGETIEDIATASTLNTNKDVYIGGDLNILTPKEQDGKFISLSLNGINKWNMAKLAQGKTVVHLYNNDIKTLNINLPHKMQEQQKIGNFFSKLDHQIELEEKKLELLEQQKRGYMEKIFSQELRFKDESGNNYHKWDNKKLNNIIHLQNGYAFQSNLFSDNGIPIIRITDINKSLVSAGTAYYPEYINIDERFKINKNDILIAMSGATTGKIGKYISNTPSYLNQRIGKFVMKNGSDSNFIFAYLNSMNFKKELTKLLVAGAQPNISSQDIENISLAMPSSEEQKRIGAFYLHFNNFIEKQSAKVQVLKQRKQGLLQKMFV